MVKIAQDLKIVEEGTYAAVIIGIDEPIMRTMKKDLYLKVQLDIGSRVVYAYVIGTMQAIMMIYRNRHLFIGLGATAIIKHHHLDYNPSIVMLDVQMIFKDCGTENIDGQNTTNV